MAIRSDRLRLPSFQIFPKFNAEKYALGTQGQNGGLILGPIHHVQLDTPLENF